MSGPALYLVLSSLRERHWRAEEHAGRGQKKKKSSEAKIYPVKGDIAQGGRENGAGWRKSERTFDRWKLQWIWLEYRRWRQTKRTRCSRLHFNTWLFPVALAMCDVSVGHGNKREKKERKKKHRMWRRCMKDKETGVPEYKQRGAERLKLPALMNPPASALASAL